MNTDEIEGYRVLAKIGEGGQGEVFKAIQLSLNRVVAIKALRRTADREKGAEEFRREAVLLASLDNPNHDPRSGSERRQTLHS